MIRMTVRNPDGDVIGVTTQPDSEFDYPTQTLAHTVGTERFVVHRDDGTTVEYQRAPELADPMLELDLSADELLREHGVVSVVGDVTVDGSLRRFREALREYRATVAADEAGEPRPPTPILDGYVADGRRRRSGAER